MLKYWAVLGSDLQVASKAAHQELWRRVEDARAQGTVPPMGELDVAMPSSWPNAAVPAQSDAEVLEPGAMASEPSAPKRRRRLKRAPNAPSGD